MTQGNKTPATPTPVPPPARKQAPQGVRDDDRLEAFLREMEEGQKRVLEADPEEVRQALRDGTLPVRASKDRLQVLNMIEEERVARGGAAEKDGEVSDRLAPGYRSLFNPLTSVSKETSLRYSEIAERLYRKYLKEQTDGLPDHVEKMPVQAEDFLLWLVAYREHKKWSQNTWRLNRSAVLHWIATSRMEDVMTGDDCLSPLLIEILYEEMDAREKGEASKKTKATSGKKRRAFPREDARAILDKLGHDTNSKHAESLIHWIRAGLYTGLRPIEWQATEYVRREISEYEDPQHFLVVLNGKATNFRGNGIMRILDISDYPEELIASI